MVKSPPSNAGDPGLILGRGTKIPHAVGQLSPRATATEPTHSGAHVLQRRALKLWSLRARTREKPVRHKEEPACRN